MEETKKQNMRKERQNTEDKRRHARGTHREEKTKKESNKKT
jgi:hypothetical protein